MWNLSSTYPPGFVGNWCASFSGFFWKDKKVLVARSVVVQAPSLGGFSAVDVKLKVQSLLVQWVRCFILASSTGVLVSFCL